MPPMTYLTQWSPRDRGLAEALMLHEAGVHTCGHQWDRATHPEMDGEYEVEVVTCYACAALDEWRSENKDHDPGAVPIVRDYRSPAKGPLPTLRTDGTPQPA